MWIVTYGTVEDWKDFATASEMQATAVDFDQLLEMVAVGFPKMKFGFLPLIHKICKVYYM
jgi:hypothetical protein